MIVAAVTFKGTGVVTIKSKFKVATVKRTATGTYRIHFSETLKGNLNVQFTASTKTSQIYPVDDLDNSYIDVICNDVNVNADAKIACLTVYSL